MLICTYLRHRIGNARSESKPGMLDTCRGLIGPAGVRNLSKVLRSPERDRRPALAREPR